MAIQGSSDHITIEVVVDDLANLMSKMTRIGELLQTSHTINVRIQDESVEHSRGCHLVECPTHKSETLGSASAR